MELPHLDFPTAARELIPRDEAATAPVLGPLLDRRLRPLHNVRISVTDRCNFRCTYCMPRSVFGPGYEFLHRRDLLTAVEIARLAGIFTALGTKKIRLTGGEPLLRADLPEIVTRLRRDQPEVEVSLTTNGSRLVQLAGDLRAAGLARLTVSLDALDEPTFRKMSDAGVSAQRVLAGIEAAVAAGFAPVKINAVIRRGVNEHVIEELAARFASAAYVVRFIEYMDVGQTNGWRLADVVPAAEIAARLERHGALTPLPPLYRGEVARRYQTAAGGEIGIIAAVTQPFCQHCDRARLTADGRLLTCLFAARGLDLRTPLRDGATDAELSALVQGTWRARDDRYSELRTAAGAKTPRLEMSAIGG